MVEVKAALDLSDVDQFLEKMKRFKELWSEFKDIPIVFESSGFYRKRKTEESKPDCIRGFNFFTSSITKVKFNVYGFFSDKLLKCLHGVVLDDKFNI